MKKVLLTDMFLFLFFVQERERERIKKLKLYPKPLKIFTESFFRGLLSGNGQWASDERVVGCFHEEARMMTHDGQMYVVCLFYSPSLSFLFRPMK